MKISSIQSYNINKPRSMQFKGTVSPEFVEYVDTLRCDCLDTYPKQCSNRINNICDNIINKAQRVMKNCFPQESVLSVDTTKSEYSDVITYSNKTLAKYIPEERVLGDVEKKHEDTPLRRLKRLHKIIFDKTRFSSDACNKDYAYVFTCIYEMAIPDKDFVKDCIPVVKFYHDNFNLYDSEMTDTNIRTQAEYAELLSKLKELSD